MIAFQCFCKLMASWMIAQSILILTRSVLPVAESGLYWTRLSSPDVAYLVSPVSLGLVHWIVDGLPSRHVFWAKLHLGNVASAAKTSDGRPTLPDQMMGKCNLKPAGSDAVWFIEFDGIVVDCH